MACGILVPLPGVEPKPAALGARSLSPWTTRWVPIVRNEGGMATELTVQRLEVEAQQKWTEKRAVRLPSLPLLCLWRKVWPSSLLIC